MHRRTPSSRSVSSSSQPLLPLPSHDPVHHGPRTPAPRSNPRRTRPLALLALVALATFVLLARRSASRDGTSSPGDSAMPASLTTNRLSFDRLPSRIKNTASLLLSLRPFSSPSLPPPTAPIILAPLPRPTEISYAEPWVYEADPSTLPACERILLFTFMPWWGFASEYILYARAAAAAKNLNYTFLEDDRNWNYGRLSNYFLPRRLSCVPPSDWSDPLLAVPLSPLSASSSPPHPRLKYSRLNLGDIDDWTREAYLSSAATQAALHALREDDLQHRVKGDRWILGEGESLPEAFGEVFSDQSEWVRENWRVAPAVREGIEAVRRAVGLDQPRWLAAEEEGEGRGPVVAVHVRLGDKASEYEHDAEEMGITNSFGNLTVYIEAAHDAYRRLIPSPYPPLSPSTQARFSPYAPPTLLLITAEPLIPARLREEVRLADPWRVVQSPGVDVEDEGEARERLRKEEEGKGGGRPKAYAAKGEGKGKEGKMIKLPLPPSTASPDPNRRRRRRSLDAGYTQQSFNALPLLSRVAHTQAFVRDLTLLAQEEGGVDAAVVSGASNVGRLAMLIAGKDAVLGPRDAQTGRPLGGRMCVGLFLPIPLPPLSSASLLLPVLLNKVGTDSCSLPSPTSLATLASFESLARFPSYARHTHSTHLPHSLPYLLRLTSWLAALASLARNSRSVDAHFYPTAYSSAVYIKIEDVEDLENAAFVPEEQHRAEVEALEKQVQGRRRRRAKGRKGGRRGRV